MFFINFRFWTGVHLQERKRKMCDSMVRKSRDQSQDLLPTNLTEKVMRTDTGTGYDHYGKGWHCHNGKGIGDLCGNMCECTEGKHRSGDIDIKMLKEISERATVYVITGYTDMRKGIDGLATIVKGKLLLDPHTFRAYKYYG